MKKFMNNVQTLLSISVFPLALLGCANNLGPGSSSNSSLTYSNPLIQNPQPAAKTTSAYSCPNSANVVPDIGSPAGTDFFTVCPSTADTTDIEVSGQTLTSANICIFPAQVTSGQLYWKPDVNGNPSYDCSEINNGYAYATFPAMSYNAVFIVESQNLTSMQACLAADNYNICPEFSYGTFR